MSCSQRSASEQKRQAGKLFAKLQEDSLQGLGEECAPVVCHLCACELVHVAPAAVATAGGIVYLQYAERGVLVGRAAEVPTKFGKPVPSGSIPTKNVVSAPSGAVMAGCARTSGVASRFPAVSKRMGLPAAPHAAGVAALMKDLVPALTPDATYAALKATAIDMDDPSTGGFDTGFDFGTGFGLIQADAAINEVAPSPVPLPPPVVPPVTPPMPVEPPVPVQPVVPPPSQPVPPPGLPLTSLTCNGLRVTMVGTEGRDIIIGTPGRDVIHGLGGNDVIHGNGGKDVICGGFAKDRLLGGPRSDRLFGDSGKDRLNGGTGRDRCNGGSGADTGVKCERNTRIP